MPLSFFDHLIYRNAAMILGTNPVSAACSRMLSRHQSKVRVLPLGLDLSRFLRPSELALRHCSRLKNELGWPLWIFVGRLVYYKALHIALQALQRVPGRLLIIG